MNLELKHLAHYLPYNLKIEHPTMMSGGRKISEMRNLGQTSIEISHRIYVQISSCKPLLRPLSYLTKEIDIDGKKFVPIDWLEEKYYTLDLHKQCLQLVNDTEEWIYQCDYMLVDHLFEWHFDVFGLIDEGLALPLI